MAYVVIEDDCVVGVFSRPQVHLENYYEIEDNDEKIINFYQQKGGSNQ